MAENLPELQVIEKTEFHVEAQDVLDAFYEMIKQLGRYQYTEEHIIDGKQVCCSHTFLDMLPPKNNYFEIRETISSDDLKPGTTPKAAVALKVTVWPVQANRLYIRVEYRPHFKNAVMEVLSKFQNDLLPIDAEKIYFVSGTKIENILTWFSQEIDRHKTSSEQLGKVQSGNVTYWVSPGSVSYQGSNTMVLKGSIYTDKRGDQKQLKASEKHSGSGIHISIHCLQLISTPINKIQVTVKCNGTDIYNVALSFLEALSKRFIDSFDAQPDGWRQTEEKEAVPENNLPPSYVDELEKVKDLSLKGLKILAISQRTGLSESTIKRYRKILGLQRHKK